GRARGAGRYGHGPIAIVRLPRSVGPGAAATGIRGTGSRTTPPACLDGHRSRTQRHGAGFHPDVERTDQALAPALSDVDKRSYFGMSSRRDTLLPLGMSISLSLWGVLSTRFTLRRDTWRLHFATRACAGRECPARRAA